MSAIKQGSVMEGIFAMYCAAYLIDPVDGQNPKAIENFIDDLRVDTTLGRLIDKTKRSVDYKNIFLLDKDENKLTDLNRYINTIVKTNKINNEVFKGG